MKIFIAGIDGYLGWPLAQYLAARGHTVYGCDIGLRRDMVHGVGSDSVIEIAHIDDRIAAFRDKYGPGHHIYKCDMLEYIKLESVLMDCLPDAIVHLAEIPSAPWSMMGQWKSAETQRNNVLGSLNLLWAIRTVCPDAHLVKLGTMGEYGTPPVDIPEGFFDIEYRGRVWKNAPFPRNAGSFYHLSKVHDSENARFACRIWGLRSTDIMQGVVFGAHIDEMGDDPNMRTRFDIDECFGTAINRYCASAIIGHPLTVYGAGGQRRGFLPLKDSMQCLTLTCENPPAAGEYRVFNQFEAVYNVTELAHMVCREANSLGMRASVEHYENPRMEAEKHRYNPDHKHLLDIGYEPTTDISGEIRIMLQNLSQYKDRIEKLRHVLIPQTRWDGKHRRSKLLEDEK